MSRQRQRSKPRPAVPAAPVARPRAAWRLALLLFLLGLAVRGLAWRATSDAAWPYSALYKGDALVFLEQARELQRGRPPELGLPIHPPGTARLLAWTWNGQRSGFAAVRALWVVMGALAAPLLFLAARPAFGERVAAVAAGGMALLHGSVTLSLSPGSEAPALLLLLAGLLALVRGPGPVGAAGFGALGGLACLFRVELVVAVALLLAWLAWRCRRPRPVLGALAGLALALLPWHLQAWSTLARSNHELAPGPTLPPEMRADWSPEAAAWRERWPGFARATAAAFVEATVRHRGRARVEPTDAGLLEEAFGSTPQPLARFPFVSLYGPLNFALANRPGSDGGFSPSLLEQRPPLRPAPEAYPPALVAGLPPPQLAFSYPPHLRLVNDGYALGLAALRADPSASLRLIGAKLAWCWRGVATGLGAANLPLGSSGTRRAVDVFVADDTALALAWRLGLAALALAGLLGARGLGRGTALLPWLALGAGPAAAALAFFGYARLGALALPAFALLWALALERWLWPRLEARGPRAVAGALLGLALLVLVADLGWAAGRPQRFVDGRQVRPQADPFPADVHRHQRIETR